MILSDTAVLRPVFATVLSVLLVIFGLVAFSELPLREYPDIDPPVVTIETNYVGASAAVVDSQITQVIEERIAGIEGIEFIEAQSEDGQSEITVRFAIDKDINEAANDIRDRVSSAAGNLPDAAEPPEVQKPSTLASIFRSINWHRASSSILPFESNGVINAGTTPWNSPTVFSYGPNLSCTVKWTPTYGQVPLSLPIVSE